MQRYFVNPTQINNNIVSIIGDDVYHITNVMRMKVSDNVTVSNGTNAYLCSIKSISKEEVILNIENELFENKELKKNIHFAHGLVRKEKMEEVIDYLTELGALSYTPVVMSKSIVKVSIDDFNKKLDRLNKIAKEASEQSLRLKKLSVNPLISFNDFVKSFKNYDKVLVCDTNESVCTTLKESYLDDSVNNILIVIGPESGFDKKELDQMYQNNANSITLGKRILRTQLAPIYAMSVLGFLDEDK